MRYIYLESAFKTVLDKVFQLSDMKILLVSRWVGCAYRYGCLGTWQTGKVGGLPVQAKGDGIVLALVQCKIQREVLGIPMLQPPPLLLFSTSVDCPIILHCLSLWGGSPVPLC